MKIIDLNGQEITVTDLDKAIEQAELFKDMHHVPPVPYDKVRQVYWNDIYKKLLELKSKLDHEQPSR
ncbi:3-isopropylmalate dehydratase [Chryseobacterium elymi]|uniref:3-isopropylmalate dehydratase n=1 Tax=Chryseobacterium elymi TaxID=395936 RepID=A0A3D9DN35_9FLAO|nr:3-isopropylmalate dehydratase [Chryseobacterium elymi]REC79455.1 3-isopropylmalate dehydratase [Chryseobacterium elymi]